MTSQSRTKLFSRGSWPEAKHVARILRRETVGGILLLVGTVIALVWINSPLQEYYEGLRDFKIGPSSPFHLDLTLHGWAADGLLAIFFFVAGLEVKHEFLKGDLKDPRRALVPIVAAVCGVIVPAGVYLALTYSDPELSKGWAIPTATDIAFALAILAVVGRFLPSSLRSFLLTLAVVDDLIAIAIIAFFYSDKVQPLYLALAVIPLAAFAFFTQKRITTWWILVPLAVATWVLVHESGVHATVAGVLLGLVVPVHAAAGEKQAVSDRLDHALRPISAGIAVPVFALMSAGVPVTLALLGETFTHPAALGVILGLIVGKFIGVFGGAYLTARFTQGELADDLEWVDVAAVALLAGVGFTVSLLVSELSFKNNVEISELARAATLVGSLLAAGLAAVLLSMRNRAYKRIWVLENRDDNHDGIPDVYQKDTDA